MFVVITPDWYSDYADEAGFELTPGLPATHAHIFCSTQAELKSFLAENDLEQIEKSLWISWLKKASGKQSDLSENDIRDAILPLGWVDRKVAAVDEIWSGLKFLRRAPDGTRLRRKS